MTNEEAIKLAASMGVKLTITNQSSSEILFPEKLEMANKVIAKLIISEIE